MASILSKVTDIFKCKHPNWQTLGERPMMLGDLQIGKQTIIQCTKCKQVHRKSYSFDSREETIESLDQAI